MADRRHVRRKNGRMVTATRAHDRRVAPPPATRRELPLAEVAERLGVDLVALHVARADQRAGKKPEEAIRAIQARVTRRRRELVSRGPEGVDLNRRITLALASGEGRVFRTAELACATARPYARRVARYLVGLVVEGMRDPLALARAGSYAAHQALADLLTDYAYQADASVGLTVTESRTTPKGSRLTNSWPAIGDVLKLAHAATSQARLELLTALDLEERTSKGSTNAAASAMEARVEALIERDARLAEEGRKILAERARVIDVAHEPAPVAATPPPVPSSAPSTPHDEHDEAVALPTRTRPSRPDGTPDPGAVAWNERALRMLNPHYEPEAAAPPPTNPPKAEPVTPITYEVAKPGEPVRPSWWGMPKTDAPAVADAFAAIKAAHAGDPVAMAFAAYRDVVGPAKDKAQRARDMSRAYSGPRLCPAFVTRWLRGTGRHHEIDHLKSLGFFVEEEGSN